MAIEYFRIYDSIALKQIKDGVFKNGMFAFTRSYCQIWCLPVLNQAATWLA